MNTVTLNAAKGAIEHRIGFPASRIRTIAQRLQEHGLLPSGAPGVSPELDIEHVVVLVLALATDTTLAKVAEAVGVYGSMSPGGADVTVAPASIPRNAREALLAFAELAIDGNSLSSISVEVVATWPEISLLWTDGTAQRFREVGALASHWADGRHRRSTTINGNAFAAVFADLFGVK